MSKHSKEEYDIIHANRLKITTKNRLYWSETCQRRH